MGRLFLFITQRLFQFITDAKIKKPDEPKVLSTTLINKDIILW